MKKKRIAESGLLGLRIVVFCTAACLVITGTLLGFFRSETPTNTTQRTLTFQERVAYQRAIEEVYWRHRIWPKERPDHKPSLDAVMFQGQLEKRVAEYLRNSQALEDYWRRPITAEQLQAEMNRMAKHTKQPEVLRELFEALANDPFVIAECLARPALAERLLTNWYAYDQTIHGGLRQRAEADVHEHPTIEQMKQTSGTYSEIEFVRSDTAQEKSQRTSHPMNLNASEWVKIVDKLTAMCGDGKGPVAAGVPPTKAAPITDTKVGMLSPLQEDETRYYATAIIQKTENRLKVATVSWSKESLESWLNGAGGQIVTALPVLVASYTFPTISDAAECADDSWTATAGPPDARFRHTAVWTGSEMIIWGGADGSNDFNTGYRYNPATDTWV